MKTVEELVREYLPASNVIQLATSVNNQPWACNVHFYSDEDLNIYWISTPERRHSEEIAQNPKVAAVIKVHENTPKEGYVIGLTIEGTAELLAETVDPAIVDAYAAKHAKDPKMMADIKAGTNPNKFYKLTSRSFVLFSTSDFTDNPRQEWKVGE